MTAVSSWWLMGSRYWGLGSCLLHHARCAPTSTDAPAETTFHQINAAPALLAALQSNPDNDDVVECCLSALLQWYAHVFVGRGRGADRDWRWGAFGGQRFESMCVGWVGGWGGCRGKDIVQRASSIVFLGWD
jgi:hypothetical protein